MRFQQKVIAAFQERIKWMETFEAKANDKLKSKIRENQRKTNQKGGSAM